MKDYAIKIDFQLGKRPYYVLIDPDERRILGIQFDGYDSCWHDYPQGPFSDDAKAMAELLFEDWLKRETAVPNATSS